MKKGVKQTHESYILAIRDAILYRLKPEAREKLTNTRFVYGMGHRGIRGITYYDMWKHDPKSEPHKQHAVVEVCIFGEENSLQIAGTMLHEMGHVLAGYEAAHGPMWKDWCHKIGYANATATINYGDPGTFDEEFVKTLSKIPPPDDGTPGQGKHLPSFKGGKTCSAGHGTHGGKSRGTGSGSRMKKLECPKCGYTCRTTKKWLEKGLPTCPCGMKFIDLPDKGDK